jgi:Ca2+-binding RTX toxin-like protein
VSHMRSCARLGVLIAVFVPAFALLAIPAVAATCLFAPPTVTVDVGAGETATIGRSGADITLNGAPCGGATVTTTETIAVTATGVPTEIGIDLTGGPLAPGLTPEADGSEIEITINIPTGTPTLRIVGSTGVDHIVAGESGINLNSDETTADVDVTITGTPVLVIDGGDGDDVLSLGGGAGTGTAGRQGSLLGQAGNDRLLGGVAGSAFDGGVGTDEVDYTSATQLQSANLSTGQVIHQGGGTDTLAGIENLTGSPDDDRIVGSGADNVIDGGDGTDTIDFSTAPSAMDVDLRVGSAVGDGNDTLSAIENVIGSPLDDHIVGGGGGNLLDGGLGDDKIDGGVGDDTLTGGEGTDTVSFQSATVGVTVSLTRGTAEGDGADTLQGFENVVGTPKADEIHGDGARNRLDGRRGPDQLYAGNGADIILGGDGNDLLFGQRGDDLLLGESAKDQLDGGRDSDVCKGGSGPDSFVFCETINAGPPSIRLI